MFLAALFCEVKGLEPLGKYFLVRFVQCFGSTAVTGLKVKDLAKRFGISDPQVSEVLAALVACDVLNFSSIPEGRGRPKRCYQLTDSFLKNLNKAFAQPATQHDEIVRSLLMHENRKAGLRSDKSKKTKEDWAPLASLRGRRQPDQLSAVNRLLLSVLLCHADRTGVVRDLGSATLCKVTGLTKEGLKHRVQRLIDQGAIRGYVPGATSTVLSAKMKSIYFLNLNHPELSVEGGTTSVLVCAMSADPSESVPHAHQIYSDIVILKRNPTVFGDEKEQRLRFFESQPLSFFHLLQVMLEKYAADMLSRHWSDLDQSASSKWTHVQEWKALIRKDFRFPKLLPSVGGDHLQKIDEDRYAALISDLHYGAYALAKKIKNLLCQASEISFDTMDFVIVPQPMARDYCGVTLLARPHDSDGWRGCLYFESHAKPQAFSYEAEIPLKDRSRLGLLTQPGSKVKSA
ncbi:hypothetical protein [Pseudomonas syringae]|uniref:hypothetical protein n=1 Tax=Pseudomonas syringae TaxID=317 RepID=UPI00094516D3|nr:hypothetical protein [Pseudomonas syringae]